MSDGERVAFYLIGQCLAAPDSGIIVVDEPELHLHRSIRAKLWNAIEEERNDCQFVYLTHDLEFAANREATLVWLKNYDGDSWDWEKVPEDGRIPKEVLLSIIGSRKNVLFVEGDWGSLDYKIYSRIYSNLIVVPCGNCRQVIEATRSFSSMKHMHQLDCYGLIDPDYRPEDELQNFEERDVYVPDVSEVENLMIAEEVIHAVAERRMMPVDEVVSCAKENVLELLEEQRERVASSIAAQRIRNQLDSFGAGPNDRDDLEESFRDATDIDLGAEYERAEEKVDEILAEEDYERMIRIFDNKGLVYHVGKCANVDGDEYKRLVLEMISSKGDNQIADAMREYLPEI